MNTSTLSNPIRRHCASCHGVFTVLWSGQSFCTRDCDGPTLRGPDPIFLFVVVKVGKEVGKYQNLDDAIDASDDECVIEYWSRRGGDLLASHPSSVVRELRQLVEENPPTRYEQQYGDDCQQYLMDDRPEMMGASV